MALGQHLEFSEKNPQTNEIENRDSKITIPALEFSDKAEIAKHFSTHSISTNYVWDFVIVYLRFFLYIFLTLT